MVEIKTAAQIATMRLAGLVVARTLGTVRAAVRPGVTTKQLDEIAEAAIRDQGATPNFLGYHGYPASICASVDDEIVHGIPGGRVLHEGEVVSIDCGAIVDGWHGDAAVTVPVGEVAAPVQELMRVTEESLWAGLAAVRPGARLTDIGAAVEAYAKGQGRFGIIREYGGHGIGTAMHQEPFVPNYLPRRAAGRGPVLEPGLVLAVEPMLTAGGIRSRVLDDEWTVVTKDGSVAAHSEHTVAVTEQGAWVLTAFDGGRRRLGDAYGGPAAQDVPDADLEADLEADAGTAAQPAGGRHDG